MDKDNGSKPKLPDDKDYIVLTSLLIQGLQKTLDMYDQKKWQLMAVLNAPDEQYIMVFRRRLQLEF